MANTYIVYNGAAVTTGSAIKVTTGTATKTMLQLASGSMAIKVVEWGISFDGTTAATPIEVELIDTGSTYATVTALAAADVVPFFDPNAFAQTAGATGQPLSLSASASGYTATAEGTITSSRYGDLQMIAPTNSYVKQFPLGREFGVSPSKFLRVRVSASSGAVNALCYVVFEV